MASQGEISAVEVYTTDTPCMAKEVQYKGMILVSKNKSRNMFSDIGSGDVDDSQVFITLITRIFQGLKALLAARSKVFLSSLLT